jgi:hypothetical protein
LCSVSVVCKEQYKLSVDKPWENPYGILVASGRSITKGAVMLDNVSIYFPIACVRDVHEKKVTAELLPSNNGIRITMPTIPSVLVSTACIEKMHKQVSSGFCLPSQNAHKAVANEIKDKKHHERCMKQIIFLFPDGMTCNTSHFNYKAGGPKLKNHFLVADDSIELNATNAMIIQEHYILWKLVIENHTRT